MILKKYKKINKFKKKGFCFFNKFKIKDKIHILNKIYKKKIKKKILVSIMGRIIFKRIMGKNSFATIQDFYILNNNNNYIQIYISNNFSGYSLHKKFKKFDIGDIIYVKGFLFFTKTKELTIKVNKIYLLSKIINYLPNKFYGLLNKEIKYRKRYIDLIINNNTKNIFYIRSKIISIIRNFMEKKKFLEVETPMLHNIPGGALAKPFITYHNSLNMKMFLRISPELYLKKLIIGGFNKIFEINRNFRNEGISLKHNPEFTMMEFYSVFTNYKWNMNFTEKIIKNIAFILNKSLIFKYSNYLLNFNKSFDRFNINDILIKYYNKYNLNNLKNFSYLLSEIKKKKIFLNKKKINNNNYELCFYLFENNIEYKLINPTFITNYPISISPLSKAIFNNKYISERFELFICGYEIANGFSELNDSKEQFKRFKKQIYKKNNKKNVFYDKEYIEALEYGMPPTSGCGIGIDRLVMLFTNKKNIKDVILFPNLKKK